MRLTKEERRKVYAINRALHPGDRFAVPLLKLTFLALVVMFVANVFFHVPLEVQQGAHTHTSTERTHQ